MERSKAELIRQFFHIGLGLFIFITLLLFSRVDNVGMLLVFLLLAALLVNACHVETCPFFLLRAERPIIGAGLLYYLASLLFLVSWKELPLSLIIVATLALAIEDGFSTLFGLTFGEKKLFGNKTLEGTLWGFLAYFLALLFLGFSPLFSLTLALLVALTELFSPINDNILVPFMAALFGLLLYIGGII